MTAVLCDDDALVVWAWNAKAQAAGIVLKTYKSSKELLDNLDGIEKDTPIYLDSRLEDGVSGIEIARALHGLGYQNLYCTTGFADEAVKNCRYFKKVLGKSPPF